MTNRPMGYSTNITPSSGNTNYPSPRSEAGTSTPSFMITRGFTRTRPIYRPYYIHLAEAGPLRSTSSISTQLSHPPHCTRCFIHTNWRLRWTQSNTTTEDLSLFIHRPPGVDAPGITIFPRPHPSNTSNISCNNHLNLPYLYFK